MVAELLPAVRASSFFSLSMFDNAVSTAGIIRIVVLEGAWRCDVCGVLQVPGSDAVVNKMKVARLVSSSVTGWYGNIHFYLPFIRNDIDHTDSGMYRSKRISLL